MCRGPEVADRDDMTVTLPFLYYWFASMIVGLTGVGRVDRGAIHCDRTRAGSQFHGGCGARAAAGRGGAAGAAAAVAGLSSFDENYGANATFNGPNITLDLPAATTVKFYYDHKTHWITDSRDSVIAIAPGNFQSELGCSSDWDPSCLRSWLEDPDGNGTYQFSTDTLPAGDYEAKVAINESWDESYGAGGDPLGTNIAFTVPADATVTFSYDAISHVLSVTSTTGTTTLITSDAPDPSAAGQPVTVRYTVTPSSGTGTPTGTVTVSDGTASWSSAATRARPSTAPAWPT